MSTGVTGAIRKQLRYVLRHRPDAIGIVLDRAGWVAVDELLAALARHGTALDRAVSDLATQPGHSQHGTVKRS